MSISTSCYGYEVLSRHSRLFCPFQLLSDSADWPVVILRCVTSHYDAIGSRIPVKLSFRRTGNFDRFPQLPKVLLGDIRTTDSPWLYSSVSSMNKTKENIRLSFAVNNVRISFVYKDVYLSLFSSLRTSRFVDCSLSFNSIYYILITTHLI